MNGSYLTPTNIIKVLQMKGYQLFDDDSNPYNLNLIGIRTCDMTPNIFNDWLCVMWKHAGAWEIIKHIGTTDPGLYYLNNPLNVEGTAILKPDQYLGMFSKGKHRGQYEALVQTGKCTVYRDNDRDNYAETGEVETEEGLFGLNSHRATKHGTSKVIGKFSAGCQVRENVTDHEILMKLIDRSIEFWGNSFTYTLLEEEDFLKWT